MGIITVSLFREVGDGIYGCTGIRESDHIGTSNFLDRGSCRKRNKQHALAKDGTGLTMKLKYVHFDRLPLTFIFTSECRYTCTNYVLI